MLKNGAKLNKIKPRTTETVRKQNENKMNTNEFQIKRKPKTEKHCTYTYIHSYTYTFIRSYTCTYTCTYMYILYIQENASK